MPKLTLDEAKVLLEQAAREQLVDSAFGDAEVYWFIQGVSIAQGYFGRSAEIGFDANAAHEATEFTSDEAWEFRYLGELTKSERND